MLEFENERDRESFFEDYIAKQTNTNYLIGFREGLMVKRNLKATEKLYYCGLVYDRLNVLKGGKK